MSAFWALAGRDWPPRYPTHQLVNDVGPAALASLLATGVLREEAIRPHDTVPCTACRRRAEVIFQRGSAFAICSGARGCPDEDLGPAPSWASMNAEDFTRRLAAAFGLDGLPGVGGAVVPLGARRFGDETAAVDLCPHPAAQAVAELTRLARNGPSVRVVLVPDSRRLRADLPRELDDVAVVWAGLDEVLTLDRELGVDFAPICARRGFRGLSARAAVPSFAGLAVGKDGARWGGQVVIGPELAQALTCVRTLAAQPGVFVSSRQLWQALWPLEHTRSGELARLVNPLDLDRRLRHVVGDVREALAVTGVENVVENKRKVGYRLTLAPELVSVV